MAEPPVEKSLAEIAKHLNRIAVALEHHEWGPDPIESGPIIEQEPDVENESDAERKARIQLMIDEGGN